MTMRVCGDVLGFAGLVGLSIAVPMTAWLGGASGASPETEPGLGWLSMPVGLAVRSPSWRGWELLCPERPVALPVEAPLAVEPPSGEASSRWRLGYRGTLEGAGKPRYWFEDLASGRRMALSAGEEDPVTRLRLIEVHHGNRATFHLEGQPVPLQIEWERK